MPSSLEEKLLAVERSANKETDVMVFSRALLKFLVAMYKARRMGRREHWLPSLGMLIALIKESDVLDTEMEWVAVHTLMHMYRDRFLKHDGVNKMREKIRDE